LSFSTAKACYRSLRVGAENPGCDVWTARLVLA
jgi:hypothetical protein